VSSSSFLSSHALTCSPEAVAVTPLRHPGGAASGAWGFCRAEMTAAMPLVAIATVRASVRQHACTAVEAQQAVWPHTTLLRPLLCLFLQWGVAYRLAGNIEQQQQTLQYLEWREKQYDKRVHADIYTKGSPAAPAVCGALVYIATDGPQNVNYLGPAPLQDIAQQAATAVGPSGPNYEYILRLADAMREVGFISGFTAAACTARGWFCQAQASG